VSKQSGSSAALGPVTSTASQPLAGHRTTLVLLMLAYTLSMCDRMILSILFPDIKAEFGLTDTQLGFLGGISFALFYATMGLPIARLSDQYSRKWIIIISLVVFSLMTAFSGLAAGFISLLILRIGVGIGEAGMLMAGVFGISGAIGALCPRLSQCCASTSSAWAWARSWLEC
jgi:MFS family permease